MPKHLATFPDGRTAEVIGDIDPSPLQQQRFEGVMAGMSPGESKLVEGFKITMGAPPAPPQTLGGNIGPRPPGGYTASDAPEGKVSQTIRGMQNPSPEHSVLMTLLPMIAGGVGTNRSPALRSGATTRQASQALQGLTEGKGSGIVGTGRNMMTNLLQRFKGSPEQTGGSPNVSGYVPGPIPPAPGEALGTAETTRGAGVTPALPKAPGGAPGASTAPSSRVPGKDMGPLLQRFQDMLKADQGATGTPNLRAGGQAKTLAELASQLATEQGAPAGTKVTAIKKIPMVGGKGTPADLRQVQNILADMLKDPGRFPPKYQAILKEIKGQGGKATPEQLALLAGAMGGLAYAGKKVYDKVKQGGQTVNKSLNSFQRYSDLMKDAGQQP